MSVTLHHGNCVDVLKRMADSSVDSIVTDPPYGLGFMDKVWDTFKAADVPMRRSAAMDSVNTGSSRQGGRQRSTVDWQRRQANDMRDFQAWCETWAVECLRVLKPGGHMLAFGGTRTYHRLASAIEDAGFEVRDQIGWAFGSGFPKSRNGEWGGTALKPAWEPICMARKSTIGTVEANWREHGTGALNIDACRVTVDDDAYARNHSGDRGHAGTRDAEKDGATSIRAGGGSASQLGRWPANLIHDGSEEVVALFPSEAGAAAPVHKRNGDKFRTAFGTFKGNVDEQGSTFQGDTGSAARFFASFQQEEQCSPSSASTAPANSSLRNTLAGSVARAAAIWPSLAGIASSDWQARSTNVTEQESKTLHAVAITAMASIGSGFSLAQRLERRTLCGSLVSVAAEREQIGTTTITASLSRSDGFAERVTFTITPTPLDLGVPGFARLNYCAKASREDRNGGLQGMPTRDLNWSSGTQSPGTFQSANTNRAVQNHHPTVKPTALMRYLCRLVTSPGGTVLDPFMGSGSTGKAAVLEGFNFIGIELNPEYIEIARARIDFAVRQGRQEPLFAEAQP